MMLKLFILLVWLFIRSLQSPEAYAENQPSTADDEQALHTFITDMVFCSSEAGAKRVAEAIASIKTPNDGLLAYTLYLSVPDCSFTNIAVVDTNRALWADPSPQGHVFVFQAVESFDVGEDGVLPYIVFAPLELMDRFKACEMFLEETTNTVSGCEMSL